MQSQTLPQNQSLNIKGGNKDWTAWCELMCCCFNYYDTLCQLIECNWDLLNVAKVWSAVAPTQFWDLCSDETKQVTIAVLYCSCTPRTHSIHIVDRRAWLKLVEPLHAGHFVLAAEWLHLEKSRLQILSGCPHGGLWMPHGGCRLFRAEQETMETLD